MASEYKRIVRRMDGLEARADRHDIAARLRGASEEKINARLDEIEARMPGLSVDIDRLMCRVMELEARLSSNPDDFSTGEPKTMKRWMVVSGGCVLTPGSGFLSRAGHVRPAFFSTRAQASVVRDLLFGGWMDGSTRVEEVEVVERDGRLIEACYA